ncbi:MAG TPA: hypothetical protein PK559_11785 [Ignavibacteriaceae bacterium]|nr:hypothetical protein [Ignavibacteriaceae bacterium]
MERDLIFRLKKIYGDRIKTNIEYQKGIVKGHPDFELDGIPGDCKSVLMDEWLPDKKLPMKVYWQIQGYLYLSQKRNAILIYESRESGMLKVFEIFKNDNFQNQIKTKLDKIYEYFEHKPG